MDLEQKSPQKPTLKKIKRPINRMPLQQTANFAAEQLSQKKETSASSNNVNPFNKNDLTNSVEQNNEATFTDDAFNLDKFLDEEQLPTVIEAKANSEDVFSEKFDGKYSEQPTNINDKTSDLPKTILLILGLSMLFIGIVMGKFLFNSAKVVRNGLQGVVINQEIPKGRPRCGVAERTQGCVLYIMNPHRQDMIARDFYDLASQVTGRQRFVIETGNLRYSNTKIRPGDIVQLNIPPL